MSERDVLAGPVTLVSRVVQQVIAEVRTGAYRSTKRLPSEREYAGRLRVSRNTVTAAYAELEQQGVIRRLHGKGAFLCALPGERESFSWSGKVTGLANSMDEPVLEMLARRCATGALYPLSAGTPSLEIFPKDAYREALERVLDEKVPSALAVAPTEGQWLLREAIAEWIGALPQHVMITAGAQEAIDLLARCLVEPGDFAVIDCPSYPGAIQSLRSAGARLLPWGTDWSLGHLEELLLRFQPKLIFTTPTFQNPTGRVMSLKTREGLLELARRYRVPVLEDDVYVQTYFGAQAVPTSLYRLDQLSQVIAMSTFSKILAPGLRIGWLVAPPYMVKQLSLIKMRSNLFTGGLNQMVLADLLRSGEMDRHLVHLRAHHGALCEVALGALQPAIDAGLLRCRLPAGSLYLWCKVMFPMDMDLLFSLLDGQGLSVAPGAAFEPEKGSSQHFRICFTAAGRESLVAGIGVLTRELLRCRGERLNRPLVSSRSEQSTHEESV